MNKMMDNEFSPDDSENEKKCFKPWLKFRIGDVVTLKGDDKKRRLTIINYLTAYPTPDYLVVWLNSQAKEERAGLPEKSLIKIE